MENFYIILIQLILILLKNFDIKLVTPLLNNKLISYGLQIPNKFKYDEIKILVNFH